MSIAVLPCYYDPTNIPFSTPLTRLGRTTTSSCVYVLLPCFAPLGEVADQRDIYRIRLVMVTNVKYVPVSLQGLLLRGELVVKSLEIYAYVVVGLN